MKRTLIAVTVLAIASGSAIAHDRDRDKDSYLFNDTSVTEGVAVFGLVGLLGNVRVSSTAGADVQNNQTISEDVSLNPMPSTYTTGTVTTTISNNDFSIKGGGSESSSHWDKSFYVSEGAQGVEESSFDVHKTLGGGDSGHGHDHGQSHEGGFSQAFAEQSAGFREHATSDRDSEGATWKFNASLDESDVAVSGTITTHIDTQAPTTLNATTGTGTIDNVSGNVGVNITEGIDNAQSNDASLASVDAGDVFGNAQIFSNQSTSGNAHVHDYMLNASIGDNSLQHVSGNVGVNVASGVGNAQNNSLAAATSSLNAGTSEVAMVATDDNDQRAGMHFSGSMGGSAMLGANALLGSQGNIDVNVAGGVGNLQHNGLAIAAMNSTR